MIRALASARLVCFNLALIFLVIIYALLQLLQISTQSITNRFGDFIVAGEIRRDLPSQLDHPKPATPVANFVHSSRYFCHLPATCSLVCLAPLKSSNQEVIGSVSLSELVHRCFVRRRPHDIHGCHTACPVLPQSQG